MLRREASHVAGNLRAENNLPLGGVALRAADLLAGVAEDEELVAASDAAHVAGDDLAGAEAAVQTKSGEHGVGVEKRDLMNVQFDPVDLDQQRRVKDVFDPGWLLNPGKVFPLRDG